MDGAGRQLCRLRAPRPNFFRPPPARSGTIVYAEGAVKHLIVGYDSFDNGAGLPQRAIDLAKASDAVLHLVNVVPAVRRIRFYKSSRVSADEVQKLLVESRKNALAEMATHLAREDIEVETHVRTGIADEQLIAAADEIDADLIIVMDEKQSRGEHGFGPVTMKLLRNSARPVMALRTREVADNPRIMAAVEVPSNEESTSGNNVLDMAVSLARALPNSHLHILHVWAVWGEELLRSQRYSEGEVDEICAEAEANARAELESLIGGHALADDSYTVHVEKGLAKTLIPELAESLDAGIVVMGTASRGGLTGLLVGNTAEKIINKLPCSVVTVHPEPATED